MASLDQHPERKLSAILAADVAGYSRLMGVDEEGTLAALTGHRRELFDPAIARHRGRIVKTTGDGLLAEFASVVDAVRCAVAVQTGMVGRNRGVADDKRLDFRIGINVGDIVEQDGDIFGDGVNIAARLEGVAEPGGICVSARVQEDAAGRIDATFEDMGEQSLKNFARPIRAYRVRLGGGATPAAAKPPAGRGAHGLPDKPAIAVLPFQNMSGDPEQDYFADGIVEDIITALSRFRSFAVIARNSSFVYKGRSVDVRQAAKELGVRYVLEGSVRRAGQRLRITAQLIDGDTGAHLWADRFDGSVEDIFDVQDRITESVIVVIEPQIRQAEIERARRKPPENLDAYDLYLQALAKIYVMRLEENRAAYQLMQRAIELEPDYAPFLANAIWIILCVFVNSWPPLTDDDRTACLDLVQRALANARGDPAVLAECGSVLINLRQDYDRGIQIVANAVEANPNHQMVLMWAGIAKIHCGDLEESIAHSQRALLMGPGDSTAFISATAVAHANIALGRFEDGVAAAERSIAMNPGYGPTFWMLVAGNAQLGRIDAARDWLARFRALAPDVTIARIRENQPAKYPERMAAIYEGLRKAGMDEG